MSVPLPSHIHYEILLQMLERQSLFATNEYPRQRVQVQQLIIMLRKALTQQKQIEEDLERLHIPVEYRWSITQDAPSPSDSIAPNHGGTL
ncbi:MAG: DUF5340 domain-containing protein [Alkalinema sp. CAN_BIN05]|nr:DUF5340 domain-containing protein [Alkalinema sp. CAN_BIN05]